MISVDDGVIKMMLGIVKKNQSNIVRVRHKEFFRLFYIYLH